MCTKDELEEHFEILKNDLNNGLSKKFNATVWKAMSAFLILFLSIGGWLINHEGRISSTSETVTGILDTGAEFVARKVVGVEIEKVTKATDEKLLLKVDNTEFKQFMKAEEGRDQKVNTIYEYIINQKK